MKQKKMWKVEKTTVKGLNEFQLFTLVVLFISKAKRKGVKAFHIKTTKNVYIFYNE